MCRSLNCSTARHCVRLFRRPAISSGFVSSGGLDQDHAAGLDAFDCYRRMHPPDAAIRAAVRLSQHLEAEQHLLKRPSLSSSRLLCLPLRALTGTRLCRKADLRLVCRRTSLHRVNRADAAAVAAPPH